MYNNTLLKYTIYNKMVQTQIELDNTTLDSLIHICENTIHIITHIYGRSVSELAMYKHGKYRNDLIIENIPLTISNKLYNLLKNDKTNKLVYTLGSILQGLIKPMFYVEPSVNFEFLKHNIILVKLQIDMRPKNK